MQQHPIRFEQLAVSLYRKQFYHLVFPLYSPRIDSIQVVRRGDVRRAKLYYLRGRRGKSARIAEKTTGAAGKIADAERRERAAAKS